MDANTASANSQIDYAARDREAVIRVSTTGLSALQSGLRRTGFAHGGRIDGYAAGMTGYGIVPGPRAAYGVDNVLWPSYAPLAQGRATGGPILSQPLAGGEWVVNPVSSQQHDATLLAINAGASRAEIAATLGAVQSAPGADPSAVAQAVAHALAGWQPVVQIGTRELRGEMRRAERMS